MAPQRLPSTFVLLLLFFSGYAEFITLLCDIQKYFFIFFNIVVILCEFFSTTYIFQIYFCKTFAHPYLIFLMSLILE